MFTKWGEIEFVSQNNWQIFEEFLTNRSNYLVKKLPNPAHLFGINSIDTTQTFKRYFLQGTHPSKAIGIDNIS